MMYWFSILDWGIYIVLSLSVFYLFVFAVASLSSGYKDFGESRTYYKFLVLFPAYKEDKVIVNSVNSFLDQTYPKSYYDVVVISDQMLEGTNKVLKSLPVTLLETHQELGSKAKALNFAIDSMGTDYDVLVIMDADNLAQSDFLSHLNNAYNSGAKAMQAHRVAKNVNTDTAVLDAASEEINNSFFRKGQVNLGFSSALSGSGMAFDYKWFAENIKQVSSSGEDKELELLLIKQKIFIEYLDDVIVYDEKTQNSANFYSQRRRWLAAQYNILVESIKYLPTAIKERNADYCNKVLQWGMLPRVLLLGVLAFMTLVTSILGLGFAAKWWFLLSVLCLIFFIAIPKNLLNKRFLKALSKVPLLFILMFLNLFRLKGASKKFEHTEHTN